MRNCLTLIILFFCFSNFVFSQSEFVIQNRKESDKIRFKLINNLVIMPVEINGVELSFILDTGVSKPIIFNFLNITDSLKVKHTETIYIRGLGEGESVKALKSENNVIKIGDAINLNQELYAIYDSNLNFAPRLGVPVHGIIGYDLLKDLVVEVNYAKKYLRLSNPYKYQYKDCKKCERINLEFYNSKPYINAEIEISKKNIPIKLLIDSGGSDSLWLFEDDSLGIKSSNKFFNDYLGHGLSGSVYGKRSEIDAFSLKKFKILHANVAYPDSSSITLARNFKGRNGSLGGNILKRFNIIFDYKRAIITIAKNSYFKEKFTYNRSGIELAHEGVRLVREAAHKYNEKNNAVGQGFQNSEATISNRIVLDTKYQLSLKPAYSIIELRKGSPAQRAGLLIGDIILSINNKPTYNFTLQELTHKFYDDIGKKIRLKIERNGQVFTFNFDLEAPF